MSFAQRTITLSRERDLALQSFADATGIHIQKIKRFNSATFNT